MSNDTKTENASEKTAHSGRDTNGQFALGNIGAPNNPFTSKIVELRKVLVNCCTPEVLRMITNKLIERARQGDVASAKLLLTWALGKPHKHQSK